MAVWLLSSSSIFFVYRVAFGRSGHLLSSRSTLSFYRFAQEDANIAGAFPGRSHPLYHFVFSQFPVPDLLGSCHSVA